MCSSDLQVCADLQLTECSVPQVGKRTIGHGNSGSYYSGTDNSNQIKLMPLVNMQKVQNLNFKLTVDTLHSIRTFLMHQKANF